MAQAGVTSLVNAELSKELAVIEKQLLGDGDANAFPLIPTEGMNPEEILALAKELKKLHQVSFAGARAEWSTLSGD